MKTLLTVLAITFLWVGSVFADACGPLGCIFQPGTICVNGKCVPKDPLPTTTTVPTTTIPMSTTTTTIPSPTSLIKLDMVPFAEITPKEIDCSTINLNKTQVLLLRKTPPKHASFYSIIYYNQPAFMNTAAYTGYFISHKDIMNRYVFLRTDSLSNILPQFVGLDFVFNMWENKAFKEVLSTLTCDELKKSGYFFLSGISVKGDFSDFEGATFTFK